VCVGFAGQPIHAVLDTIRELAVSTSFDVDAEAIAYHLLTAHDRLGRDVDFLLAILDPIGLSRIAGGVIERNQESAWVGDIEAFEVYQRCYVGGRLLLPKPTAEMLGQTETLQPEPDESYLAELRKVRSEDQIHDMLLSSRALNSMESVINSDVESVGEMGISVISRKTGVFGYEKRVGTMLGRDRTYGPGLSPAPGRSAEQGDFSYEILAPAEPGIGAVAIYFDEGNVGVLYHPMECDAPVSFPNVSLLEFRAAVRDRYGFSILSAFESRPATLFNRERCGQAPTARAVVAAGPIDVRTGKK
jgi:hypothetical protein